MAWHLRADALNRRASFRRPFEFEEEGCGWRALLRGGEQEEEASVAGRGRGPCQRGVWGRRAP